MASLSSDQKQIIRQLQEDILQKQGFKMPVAGVTAITGLSAVEKAFPQGVFPQGTIHEFLGKNSDNQASCIGLMAALMAQLMQQDGVGIWISTQRVLYPPALKTFGIAPERIIFIDVKKDKEALWVLEEALKCEGLSAVVGELPAIDFAQSRRLQLAVENSQVTGFIMRSNPQKQNATTCAARWQISSLRSETVDELPGVGFPRWQIDLLKVRNGNPASFEVEWRANELVLVEKAASHLTINSAASIHLRTG